MKQIGIALLLAFGLALPASADVTIKQTTGGKALGISGNAEGTTYIKGNKMRSDMQMGDRVLTTILDLDAQKMISFDSRKKEADVWDMGAIGQDVSKSVDVSNMKASIKPNGQTKQFGAHTANGYDMEITVPMGQGGNKDQQMTFTLSGPVWIVRDAPGGSDYTNFYKTAAEKGFIFGDPRAAKGQPGQAKAMSEMYRQFAEIGGIAYETNMNIKMGLPGSGGGNPLGGLFAKLGNMSATTLVTDVQTGPLADDLFAPPPGYKLNQRK